MLCLTTILQKKVRNYAITPFLLSLDVKFRLLTKEEEERGKKPPKKFGRRRRSFLHFHFFPASSVLRLRRNVHRHPPTDTCHCATGTQSCGSGCCRLSCMHVKKEEVMFLNLVFSFLTNFSVAGWAKWKHKWRNGEVDRKGDVIMYRVFTVHSFTRMY